MTENMENIQKKQHISPVSQRSEQENPVIVRLIVHDVEKTPEGSQTGGSPENKEGESILYSSIATPLPGGGPADAEGVDITVTRRISKAQLTGLSRRLSERDWEVLRALKRYRFLLSSQVQRLFFHDGKSDWGNFVAANRTANKLQEYGLIGCLKRRIGGVRAGSSGKIWHLTEPGLRLLHLNESGKYTRKPFAEPSPMFLEHTLAIAETAVQLTCICRAGEKLSLATVDPEPTCWRPFKQGGRTVYLKPDLFAITLCDGYYDYWFFELDLGTEAAATVLTKSSVYRRYFNTGIEQRKNDVFPLVVWLVKDEAHKQKLREAIQSGLPPGQKIFLVITPDELAPLIHNGADKNKMC